VVEPLGASTMPQSVLPSPSQFNPSVQPTLADDASVDLDLDLDMGGGSAPTAPAPLQQPARASGNGNGHDMSMDMTIPEFNPPAAAPAARAPAPSVEFDLAGISLDLDLPGSGGAMAPAAAPMTAPSSFGDSGLSALDDDGENADPLARKLELAEEFRQIGDTEGARDLLQEVVAKASGTLKSKAQGMLDQLA
jgi:pilus assembly protein FimV